MHTFESFANVYVCVFSACSVYFRIEPFRTPMLPEEKRCVRISNQQIQLALYLADAQQ